MMFSCDKVEPETPDTPNTPDTPVTPGTPDTPVTPEEPKDVLSLEVSFPAVEGLTFYWQDGDKISASATNVSEELASVAPQTSTAVFNFPEKLNDGDMLRYPVAANPNLFNIPANWTYTDGSYLPATYPFVAKVVLPETAAETAPSVTLTNVMSMLKLEITGTATITSLTLEATGGQTLTGNYMINSEAALSGNGSATPITVTFSEGITLSNTASVVYLPVRPNTYTNGFKLVVTDDKGTSMQVKFCENGTALTNATMVSVPFVYEVGQDFSLGQLGSEAIGDVRPLNSLRIGQYNVWSDQDREEKLKDDAAYKYRMWNYAGKYVASTAVAMDCDVLCFNEISENLSKASGLQALMEQYSSEYTYSLNWPNSVDGHWFWQTSESTYANGFAYKASSVKLEASGKFWLNAKGSTSSDEDAGGKRTCVWAKFTQLATNKVFYVAVTHLSIENQGTGDGVEKGYWNLQTAKNLVAHLAERLGCNEDDTIILAGDMNGSTSSSTNLGFKYLTNSIETDPNTTLIFTDARSALKEAGTLSNHEVGYPGTNNSTYNSVSALSKESERIDHIMYRNCTVSNYASYRNTYTVAEDPSKFAWFPSDHLPISVEVVL